MMIRGLWEVRQSTTSPLIDYGSVGNPTLDQAADRHGNDMRTPVDHCGEGENPLYEAKIAIELRKAKVAGRDAAI
ncbi:uncharacterized protein N7479_009344 [Penicillium vulpinum]|uniref:uncharacterized protein n=1 Tax=Penicillium vulpinum TaxID=29845 RepID=UPI002548B308|nr:uncharacterized protein N7479_009344 [Penicillium vulpinum]KAJ5950931.1 hypothetical protein N7479_009344 [Penicillium vulpinum]